ncbi:MAG: hemin receptor [Armatimonadetes bacterium]|nr:hemin receptor [Armatimonadota bacterium]
MEPEAPNPATELDSVLLRNSFLQLVPVSDRAAETFYAILFERDPSVRPLFKNDMRVQGEKFMMMLATMLDALHDMDKFESECDALGRRHRTYGAVKEHYELVGTCLLLAFDEVLGEEFDAETRAAWQRLYGIVAERMSGDRGPEVS